MVVCHLLAMIRAVLFLAQAEMLKGVFESDMDVSL